MTIIDLEYIKKHDPKRYEIVTKTFEGSAERLKCFTDMFCIKKDPEVEKRERERVKRFEAQLEEAFLDKTETELKEPSLGKVDPFIFNDCLFQKKEEFERTYRLNYTIKDIRVFYDHLCLEPEKDLERDSPAYSKYISQKNFKKILNAYDKLEKASENSQKTIEKLVHPLERLRDDYISFIDNKKTSFKFRVYEFANLFGIDLHKNSIISSISKLKKCKKGLEKSLEKFEKEVNLCEYNTKHQYDELIALVPEELKAEKERFLHLKNHFSEKNKGLHYLFREIRELGRSCKDLKTISKEKSVKLSEKIEPKLKELEKDYDTFRDLIGFFENRMDHTKKSLRDIDCNIYKLGLCINPPVLSPDYVIDYFTSHPPKLDKKEDLPK